MNLNYEKIRSKVEQGGHSWTSYSDLFLVLSVTFLLLFVIANLRNGTSSIIQAQQVSIAQSEVAEMRKQMKAYEVLKEDYAQKGASQDEKEVYNELIGKLSLLETEARDKQEQLTKAAKEAKDRYQSLNHYQQLVLNIVNANMVAASKAKKRDTIIEGQGKELSTLDDNLRQKQAEVEQNDRLIAQVNDELRIKAERLKQAYRANRKSKAKFEKEMRELTSSSGQRVAELRSANEKAFQELDKTKTKLDAKNREAEGLVASLVQKENDFRANIARMTQENEDRVKRERAQFESELAGARLDAATKLERERKFRAAAEAQKGEFEARLGKLNSDLRMTQAGLQDASARYQSSLQALEKNNSTLQRDLAASVEKLNEQRKLAEQIKKNFARAGVNANVDPKTGDVQIEFAPDYFETDQAVLKPNMKKTLEKTIPVYADSLFEDPKIAKRLGSIEIVGFASPTFNGKEVDPTSLAPGDRQAVNYNMDLSYRRAKTIFEYVFNPDRIAFKHQKDLLPLVKVSGRSYLSTEPLRDRAPGSIKEGYCATHDCKKSQIVIVKFNLKEK